MSDTLLFTDVEKVAFIGGISTGRPFLFYKT
jgi:hypothetical protein